MRGKKIRRILRLEKPTETCTLKNRRIEMAKTAALLIAMVCGAGLMGFTEPPLQYIGGVIFLCLLGYPLFLMGKQVVKDWRGDDLRDGAK